MYMRYTQGQNEEYVLNQVLTVRVGLCTYMRHTQGQNEEYLLSRSMY